MTDIKSLTLEELKTEMERLGEKSFRAAQLCDFVAELGEKPFRAKQLYQWMHQKLARSFDGMTNLPAALRKKLAQEYAFTALRPVRVQESALDGTRKYLFELGDGRFVESVWMKYRHGNSLCISSQAGCRLRVLRFHHRRAGTLLRALGDAGPDLHRRPSYRRADFKRSGYGDRRTP